MEVFAVLYPYVPLFVLGYFFGVYMERWFPKKKIPKIEQPKEQSDGSCN